MTGIRGRVGTVLSVALCTIVVSSGVALAADAGQGDGSRSSGHARHGHELSDSSDSESDDTESDGTDRWSDEESGDRAESGDDADSGDDGDSGQGHGGTGGAAGENSDDCGPAVALTRGTNECNKTPARRGANGPDHEGR